MRRVSRAAPGAIRVKERSGGRSGQGAAVGVVSVAEVVEVRLVFRALVAVRPDAVDNVACALKVDSLVRVEVCVVFRADLTVSLVELAVALVPVDELAAIGAAIAPARASSAANDAGVR